MLRIEKFEFRNTWCGIANSLFGEKEGSILYEQYRYNCATIFASENASHSSSLYNFDRVMQVFCYMDYAIFCKGVTVSYLPFPFTDKKLAKDVDSSRFWFERKKFYSNNGETSIEEGRKEDVKNVTYVLLFSQNIFDPLIIGASKNTIFNHPNISTPYSRKMDVIFKKFREIYGDDFRLALQKDFLSVVNEKITTKIADHDLKALWRAFYSGEIDISLEDDNSEDKKDQ